MAENKSNIKKAFGAVGDFKKKHNITAIGTMLSGYIFTSRMKRHLDEGHSFWGSLGRAQLTTMKYGMGGLKLMGLEGIASGIRAYPGVKRGVEEQKAFQQNYGDRVLGGGYLDSESNMTNRARGMEQIKRNRMHLSQGLGNEAKRFHR